MLGLSRVQAAASDDLVGRDAEVADIVSILGPGRVVTLVGPAGVGKTRLAGAVADVAQGRRAYWVDLGQEAEPSMAGAVARTLGLVAVAEQDLSRQLLDRLTEEPALLILDNCEHVRDAAAEFVEHVCSRSPGTAVLVTSRERLDVPGEVVAPVAPLALPGIDQASGDIVASPAVQLLVRRAAQVRPGFRLSAEKVPAAARICRRLDGLPLSIEFAASRLRALTVMEVADGLDHDFALLHSSRRRGERHRSVTAALDWSHALLDEHDRILFRRLGVFPSSFTFDAAVEVAGSVGGPLAPSRAAVLDGLSRLIDKSFLTVSHEGAMARYRMLYVVREYAREKLQPADEASLVAGAHQRYYTELVGREAARLGRRGEAEALARLDAEIDNIDAVVRHTCQIGPAEVALELGTNLWRFCYLRGHYRRGRDWLELLHPLADTLDSPTRHARMLHGEGMLAFLQCDYAPASRAFDASLSLCRSIPDPAGTADCLLALAGVAREQGRYERAHDLYSETLRLCAETDTDADADAAAANADAAAAAAAANADANASADLRPQAARARNYLAFLAWLRADYGAAEQLGLRALEELTALGDQEGACWAWLNIGSAQLHLGDLEGARLALTESGRIADAISFREGRAWHDHLTGLLARRQGSPDAAVLLRSALAGHRALGDRWRVASVLADLATAYVEQFPAISAALFGRADALWEEIGSAPAPYEHPGHDAARAAAAAALGERPYAASWRLGRAAQPDQTLAGEAASPASPAPSGPSVPPASSDPQGQRPLSEPSEPPEPPEPSELPEPPEPSEPICRRAALGAARPGAVEHTTLEILALGASRVRVGGRDLVAADWGYAKPRELLFLLACSAPLDKDQIGDRLWPDLHPAQLRNALHTALRDLRKAVRDPAWVIYTGGRYTLDVAHGECRFDVADFEAALAGARASADPDAALRQLQDAVALYRGDLLPAVDTEWVEVRRESLRRGYVGALLSAGRELSRRRDFSAAASMYALAVDHDPFLEVAHRQLMLCWARSGESSRAVNHFQNYARRLRDELGTAPTTETRQLYQRLVSHPPG